MLGLPFSLGGYPINAMTANNEFLPSLVEPEKLYPQNMSELRFFFCPLSGIILLRGTYILRSDTETATADSSPTPCICKLASILGSGHLNCIVCI